MRPVSISGPVLFRLLILLLCNQARSRRERWGSFKRISTAYLRAGFLHSSHDPKPLIVPKFLFPSLDRHWKTETTRHVRVVQLSTASPNKPSMSKGTCEMERMSYGNDSLPVVEKNFQSNDGHEPPHQAQWRWGPAYRLLVKIFVRRTSFQG